jgi:hypothetical protein
MLKNNIVAKYEEIVLNKIQQKPLPTIDERFKVIEEINEQYFQETEDNLPSYLLTKLANWILAEELTDRHADKVTREDFPVLSDKQARLRKRREKTVKDSSIDYFDLKYRKQSSRLMKKPKKKRSDD